MFPIGSEWGSLGGFPGPAVLYCMNLTKPRSPTKHTLMLYRLFCVQPSLSNIILSKKQQNMWTVLTLKQSDQKQETEIKTKLFKLVKVIWSGVFSEPGIIKLCWVIQSIG